jgi:hypothetical protein
MRITLQFVYQCGLKGWNFGNRYFRAKAMKPSVESKGAAF